MDFRQHFSSGQKKALIILGVFTLLIVSGVCAYISFGMRNPYFISPTLHPTLLTPLALPTFPPTWTPVPTRTPLGYEDTMTPVPTQTAMPTFTPYTPYPTEVASATIQPYEPGVTPAVIGTSVAGRPIETVRFGAGPSVRVIVAGIHGGNEWNTTALADELIQYIKENPQVMPEDVSLYIIRSLNPDGLARALNPDGRVNDHGVDLNRNWDADWQQYWDRTGCWSLRPTTAGEYPNSEPETLTLIHFLLGNPADALISYHSAALGIFPAGYPPHPTSEKLAQQIAAVTDYAYPPVDTGCRYTGSMVDWAALQGIPSVDLELSTHDSTDFEMNLRVLAVLLNFRGEE